MIVINFLLPRVNELESVIDRPHVRAIASECSRGEGHSSLHYTRYGYTVQQNLPLSLRWTASYLLSCMSTAFDRCYSHSLGRWFVHWAQERHVQSLASIKDIVPINRRTQQCYLLLERAVLKSHLDYPSARGFMERLVWDCAKLLEVENFFVPTALTQQGCVQPRIRGQELGAFIDGGEDLSFDVLMQALMGCIILGLYDGFADNIIIDKDGVPHFVDNVRCFPHSNDFICVGDTLIPASRCGLLEFKICYKKLTLFQKQLVCKQFDQLKSKIPHVEAHIKNVDTRNLPPYWFNKRSILTSLHQRLNRVEQALAECRIHCLRDLVFSAHPYYRFAAALAVIQSGRSAQHLTLGGFFGDGFNFKKLVFENPAIDVVALWRGCCDVNYYFDDILKAVPFKPKFVDRSALERVWQSLYDLAELDYKDFKYVPSSESQLTPATAPPHQHGGRPTLSDHALAHPGSAAVHVQHR